MDSKQIISSGIPSMRHSYGNLDIAKDHSSMTVHNNKDSDIYAYNMYLNALRRSYYTGVCRERLLGLRRMRCPRGQSSCSLCKKDKKANKKGKMMRKTTDYSDIYL